MGMNVINGKEYTNEEAHRIMWNWLAENPDCDKDNFIDEFHVKFRDLEGDSNKCFACSECMGVCDNCPIEWDAECCVYLLSDYIRWSRSENLPERSRLAKIIAEKKWHSK